MNMQQVVFGNENRPIPKDVISLNNGERMESQGNYCFAIIKYDLSGRFAYAFDRHASMITYDTFLGIEKTLKPKIPCNSILLRDYYPLEANRGLVVYSKFERDLTCFEGRQVHMVVSIINIDFDMGIYEPICVPLEFPNTMKYPVKFDVCLATSTALLPMKYEDDEYKLHQFKLNSSYSSISLQKSIESRLGNGYYHLIDDRIICAKIGQLDHASKTHTVGGFFWINDNNSRKRISNSEACLKSNFPPEEPYCRSSKFRACWHESKCFFFYEYLLENVQKNSWHQISLPCFWVFDIESKKWAEIRVDFPSNRFEYCFNIDQSGSLNLISYFEVDEVDGNSKHAINYTRIPLKSPDKLSLLCWFRAHKYNLRKKLINFDKFF